MRMIKTTAGASVVANGDLLAMMDILCHEVTATRGLERSFEDMTNEIANLVSFSVERMVDHYLDVYRRALARPVAPVVGAHGRARVSGHANGALTGEWCLDRRCLSSSSRRACGRPHPSGPTWSARHLNGDGRACRRP